MKNLKPAEFKRLKDNLYRASHSLELAQKICPELMEVNVNVVTTADVLAWLDVVRSECWKFGPPEVQERRLREIVQQQPRG